MAFSVIVRTGDWTTGGPVDGAQSWIQTFLVRGGNVDSALWYDDGLGSSSVANGTDAVPYNFTRAAKPGRPEDVATSLVGATLVLVLRRGASRDARRDPAVAWCCVDAARLLTHGPIDAHATLQSMTALPWTRLLVRGASSGDDEGAATAPVTGRLHVEVIPSPELTAYAAGGRIVTLCGARATGVPRAWWWAPASAGVGGHAALDPLAVAAACDDLAQAPHRYVLELAAAGGSARIVVAAAGRLRYVPTAASAASAIGVGAGVADAASAAPPSASTATAAAAAATGKPGASTGPKAAGGKPAAETKDARAAREAADAAAAAAALADAHARFEWAVEWAPSSAFVPAPALVALRVAVDGPPHATSALTLVVRRVAAAAVADQSSGGSSGSGGDGCGGGVCPPTPAATGTDEPWVRLLTEDRAARGAVVLRDGGAGGGSLRVAVAALLAPGATVVDARALPLGPAPPSSADEAAADARDAAARTAAWDAAAVALASAAAEIAAADAAAAATPAAGSGKKGAPPVGARAPPAATPSAKAQPPSPAAAAKPSAAPSKAGGRAAAAPPYTTDAPPPEARVDDIAAAAAATAATWASAPRAALTLSLSLDRPLRPLPPPPSPPPSLRGSDLVRPRPPPLAVPPPPGASLAFKQLVHRAAATVDAEWRALVVTAADGGRGYVAGGGTQSSTTTDAAPGRAPPPTVDDLMRRLADRGATDALVAELRDAAAAVAAERFAGFPAATSVVDALRGGIAQPRDAGTSARCGNDDLLSHLHAHLSALAGAALEEARRGVAGAGGGPRLQRRGSLDGLTLPTVPRRNSSSQLTAQPPLPPSAPLAAAPLPSGDADAPLARLLRVAAEAEFAGDHWRAARALEARVALVEEAAATGGAARGGDARAQPWVDYGCLFLRCAGAKRGARYQSALWARAAACLREAVAVQPAHGGALLALAALEAARGRWAEAAAYARGAADGSAGASGLARTLESLASTVACDAAAAAAATAARSGAVSAPLPPPPPDVPPAATPDAAGAAYAAAARLLLRLRLTALARRCVELAGNAWDDDVGSVGGTGSQPPSTASAAAAVARRADAAQLTVLRARVLLQELGADRERARTLAIAWEEPEEPASDDVGNVRGRGADDGLAASSTTGRAYDGAFVSAAACERALAAVTDGADADAAGGSATTTVADAWYARALLRWSGVLAATPGQPLPAHPAPPGLRDVADVPADACADIRQLLALATSGIDAVSEASGDADADGGCELTRRQLLLAEAQLHAAELAGGAKGAEGAEDAASLLSAAVATFARAAAPSVAVVPHDLPPPVAAPAASPAPHAWSLALLGAARAARAAGDVTASDGLLEAANERDREAPFVWARIAHAAYTAQPPRAQEGDAAAGLALDLGAAGGGAAESTVLLLALANSALEAGHVATGLRVLRRAAAVGAGDGWAGGNATTTNTRGAPVASGCAGAAAGPLAALPAGSAPWEATAAATLRLAEVLAAVGGATGAAQALTLYDSLARVFAPARDPRKVVACGLGGTTSEDDAASGAEAGSARARVAEIVAAARDGATAVKRRLHM